MQGDSLDWTRRVDESMLHVMGQARHVGGLLQGVVEVEPVCMLVGAYKRKWTGENPGCSKVEPLELNEQVA